MKISGVTFDGRGVGFFSEPGRFGLEKMINAARRRKVDGQVFELKWPQGELAVAVQLRIISNSGAAPASEAGPGGAGASGGGNGGGAGGGALRAVALPATVAGTDEAGVAGVSPPVTVVSAGVAR